MQEMSRRTFAKGMGGIVAAAAMGCALGSEDHKAWGEVEQGATAVSAKDGVYSGYCAMCMERGSCGNRVTVKNGVVINIEGDPNRPGNRGALCPRGKGAIMNMYNPYRIKAPMKRTNPEKGMDVDPGWVEISWDEAIGDAAKKLKEVHDRNPKELVNFYGFSE